jgi:hypothetical protein
LDRCDYASKSDRLLTFTSTESRRGAPERSRGKGVLAKLAIKKIKEDKI